MPYNSTARTQYGNQKLPMAIQSNISGLTLFRSKFLSGKNNIQISPSRDSKGYSVGRQQLQNGISIFNITVPHWETYKLPLNDRDKYRIYRNGCWHECLPEGHDVSCLDGLKDITAVNVGDFVFAHDGKYHRVFDVKKFHYEGDLIKVRPVSTGHDILATPNHPFFAVKRVHQGNRGGTSPHTIKQVTMQEQMQWVASEELSVSDYLLLPLSEDSDCMLLYISDFVDVPLSDGQIRYQKNYQEAITRPNIIAVTSSLLKFCGFYVAEGHAEKAGIAFSFGRNERSYVDEVLRLGKETFGVSGKVYEYPKKIVVGFYAWYLAKLFKAWFGNRAINKKLPLWIKKLPAGKLVFLIESYMKGDGCRLTNKRRRTYKVGNIRTASKALCFDTFQALLKIGFVPSVSVQKQRGFKKGSLSYALNISANGLKKFNSLSGNPESTGIIQHRSQCFINRGYAWLRIRSIERVPFAGFVYNLEVEGANSFVTELVSVHNSMHVKYTPDEVYTFGAKPSASPGDVGALNEPLAHDIINIIEDRRIEDLGVKEWKGSKRERLFSNAYAYTRRMKVDEFFNLYLKQHYDFAKGEYIFPPNDYTREKIIRTRIANMRHEAFLQRLLVKRIKGHENLPHAELRVIDKEARMVEKQLEKIEPIRDNLKERHKIFAVLATLSMKVIRDLGLQFYTPQLTKVGESSWDQSFDSTTVNPGDEEKTRAGIDDYFDEMMSIEVVCADCGAHYSKKLGVRE